MEQIMADINQVNTMPADMKLLETEDPEPQYLNEIVRWMKTNDEKMAAVSMDNILGGLREIEDRFDGSAERPGLVRSVNAEMSSTLRDLKSRMIPVIRTMEECTKIEYMGYENILFMPDLSKYTQKQIVDFIEMNNPCAVAIPADKAASQFHSLLSGELFVYAYDVSGPAQRAALTAIGVDGFLDPVDLLF
jgi:hypothetical protein